MKNVKRLLLLIIGLSLFAPCSTATQGQEELEQAHKQWLNERYAEAISIRPGMSRAELLRVFKEDGGFQSIPATRYILRSCDMIQIEVKFDTEYGQAYKDKPDEDLKITKVSRPYLKYPSMD
jgi:hypothetical protein